MKYIVKNCPSAKGYNVFGIDTDCCCYDKHDYCKNISDCLIKRVLEKATETIHTTFNNECFDFAKDITNMFEIEGVKE